MMLFTDRPVEANRVRKRALEPEPTSSSNLRKRFLWHIAVSVQKIQDRLGCLQLWIRLYQIPSLPIWHVYLKEFRLALRDVCLAELHRQMCRPWIYVLTQCRPILLTISEVVSRFPKKSKIKNQKQHTSCSRRRCFRQTSASRTACNAVVSSPETYNLI